MSLRANVTTFALANPLYVGATVTFYVADENGQKTDELANIYETPNSDEALRNPQILDSEGKFKQPIYIDQPVVAALTGMGAGDHDTGAITIPGRWRGNWATDTLYYAGEFVVGPVAPFDVYQVDKSHVSDVFATDLTAGRFTLAIDMAQVADSIAGGVTVTATGTTTPRSQADRAGLIITPRDFGAIGDGVADDSDALIACFKDGRMVEGEGLIYRITKEIDLRGYSQRKLHGYGQVAQPAAPGGFLNSKPSTIIQDTDNTRILRLSGYGHDISGWALLYRNQQTAAQTNSIALELNNVSAFNIRNLRIMRGNTHVAIPQSAFSPSTFNAIWNGTLQNIDSNSASLTHYDLRNYNGGGTNVKLLQLYANGGGALDFSSAGQVCSYVFQGRNWSGWEMDALSVDALTFTEKIIEVENAGGVFIPTLRFESCECQKNADGWVKFTGGETGVFIGNLTLYRCRALSTYITTATYIFYLNATVNAFTLGSASIASNCDFPSGKVNRLIIVGGSDKDIGGVNIGPCYNLAANFTCIAWSETFTSFPLVRSMSGRFIGRLLQAGISSTTSREFVSTAAPGSGTWALGDRLQLVQPGDYGRPWGLIVGGAGTPGTWAPMGWVGGQFTGTTNGDSNLTLTPKTSRGCYVWGTTLTATRTATLDTTGATNGDIFVIQRSAGGAFSLDVKQGSTLLAQLLAFETALFRFDGFNWLFMGKLPTADGASSVVAHKNGADQTAVAANSFVKVTFPTEESDSQGGWDATNSKFITLASGRHRFEATVGIKASNVVDATGYELWLYRNGSAICRLDKRQASGTGDFSLSGGRTVFCDSSVPDNFEIYVKCGAAAESDKTISGLATDTFICIEKL